MRKKPPALDIISALGDVRLIGDAPSPAQSALLRSIYGLWLPECQLEIYKRATGRESYTPREYREAAIIVGRRGGKSSKIAANIAVFEAAVRPHLHLARGERAHVIVLATTQKQASVTFNYIRGKLENSPVLNKLIQNIRSDEIELSNRATIGVWPCNFRSIRGLSIACCIAEEVAFWRTEEGANPAEEVLAAVRPALATFPNSKLLLVSSPWAKGAGPLWTAYQNRLTRDDALVWKLPSPEMNPSLDQKFLAAEKERDPETYAREFEAEFAEAASALLPAEAIESCVVRDRFQTLPQPSMCYVAALDAAFKSDAFAFALCHKETSGKVVVDLIKSWKPSRGRPVQMAEVVSEIAATMQAYRATRIWGDQMCSEPIRQALAQRGIVFEQAPTMGRRAASIFSTLRSLVMSQQIELLDDKETISELKRLELVVLPGGNQRVEASTGHDDRAVALALAAHQAVSQRSGEPWFSVLRLGSDSDADRGWHRA